jgi:hypothetical protein
MRAWRPVDRLLGAVRALAVLGVALGLVGCGLDEQDEPALSGPSETGISAQLNAFPDTINADGVSQSVVQLILRDQTGAPAGGRAVLFLQIGGDGYITPSASSTFVGPLSNGSLVMATADDGTAEVIYTAGYNVQTATIGVRPYSYDATSPYLSSIEIAQR